MSKINNGGPAFPAGSVRKSRPAHDAGGDWVETDRVQPLHQGLTTRDYFAAKAMQGMCVGRSHTQLKGHSDGSAKVAYEIADAMLRAREAE